mmetsp:Transcript_15688/g.24074  ORF Transcript_15688/g.24074 Transcript_15688/m.24074 type:complete len:201 (-) Transcript_15688:131-733(-)
MKGQSRSNCQLLRDSHQMYVMDEFDKDDALNYVETADPQPREGYSTIAKLIDDNSITDNYNVFQHEGVSIEASSLPNQTHDHSVERPSRLDEEDCYGSKLSKEPKHLFHPKQNSCLDHPTRSGISPSERSPAGARKKSSVKMTTVQHKPMVFGNKGPKPEPRSFSTMKESSLPPKKAKVEVKPTLRAASKGHSFRKRQEP